MATSNDLVIGTLNAFLRGEVSAVETYRQALAKVTDGSTRTQLQTCEQDHQQRVELLRRRIREMGGTPAQGSGAWGAWAKLLQGGADLLGPKAAVDTLEQGEDHGLKGRRGTPMGSMARPEPGWSQHPAKAEHPRRR
jgi:hypothetical protein